MIRIENLYVLMNGNFKKQFNNNGLTLIEVVVSLGIFSLVVMAAIGIFSVSLKSVRQTFDAQIIQEAGRFILETIAKDVRVGRIVTTVGGPYSALEIINAKSETIIYSFNCATCTFGTNSLPPNLALTGYFYVQQPVSVYFVPPRVTIVLTARSTITGLRIDLQTTVSSREYAE